MSDRDPGAGPHRPDRRSPAEWADERVRSGSSVFGPPTCSQQPDAWQQGAYPPPAPDERGWPAWQDPPAYRGRSDWQPGWHDQPAYPPGPGDTAPYAPGAGDTAPYPPVGWPPAPGTGPPRDPDGRPGPGSRRPGGGRGGTGRRPAGRDPRRERSPRDERSGRGGRRGDERSPRGAGGGLPLGAGALVGLAGLTCFVQGLAVLPWFVAGGQEATLADIRTAFSVAETDPDEPLAGPAAEGDQQVGADQGGGSPQDGAGGDLPVTVPSVPSPDEVTATVEDAVRDEAARVAASAIDSGKARYLELYTDTLGMVAIGAAALAVVFSTILTPRSTVASLLLGIRSLAGLVVILAGAAHGVALWVVFSGAGAPSPAVGVWLGVGGLAGVFLACLLGPKR